MRKFMVLVVAGLAVTAVPAAVMAGAGDGYEQVIEETSTTAPKKVFVCKYVGTPGVDERLQTGQNPISVSVNAIPIDDPQPGDEFADAQGRSVVIAFDTGQPEPDVSECPPPEGGTTTTTSTTTTTLPPTTSTSTTSTTSTSTSTTSTTTTTLPGTTTTLPGTTTTTTAVSVPPPPTPPSTTTTTTLPPTFNFGAAATICVQEVPTIRITFQNLFPQLAGVTGTLTLTSVNGAFTSSRPLVYQPGATVDVLYPGTSVNADGSIADVPGWILQPNGLWVLDPTDAFLRDGIVVTYTVNPTATATVTYPPASSACADPENPPPGLTPNTVTPTPGGTPGPGPGGTPTTPGRPLPSTGSEHQTMAIIAALCCLIGSGALVVRRRGAR